jgi:predicted XRE-type DNA-binding protein
MRQATKKRFTSVWDAIEDAPEKAANLKPRSSLMIALKKHLAGTGLSQTHIAKLFGITQPRVSDLMRGKIDVFGLDALVNMAATAGLRQAKRSKSALIGEICVEPATDEIPRRRAVESLRPHRVQLLPAWTQNSRVLRNMYMPSRGLHL